MSAENPIHQLAQLTERQRDVLQLFCSGLDYKAIGERLFIAVPTVKTHMGNIYIKLGTYHLPPPRRKIVLVERYCPLLKGGGLPPAQPDVTEEPEPVPESVMRMVEEDEKALIPWEPRQPVTIIEPQPVRVIERLPPPRPKRLPWLLAGLIFGALAAVGVVYAIWGFPWAEEPSQGIPVAVEVTREVRVEVTSALAPAQPSPASVAEVAPTVVDTAISEDTETPVPPSPTPEPTDTPIPPTPTPIPTDTPVPIPTVVPDTPSGTILAMGETWMTGGFHARLDGIDFAYGDEADLYFTFINRTGKTLFFYFNPKEHITMQDDLERFFTWKTPYDSNMIMEHGESHEVWAYKGGDFSGASYFIITLNIPDIIYAQWRYN